MLFLKARAKIVGWVIINSVPVLNLVRSPARLPTRLLESFESVRSALEPMAA